MMIQIVLETKDGQIVQSQCINIIKQSYDEKAQVANENPNIKKIKNA